MGLEFPDDPTAWYLDQQFMIGESLLAAPVFEESGEVEFYLPKGRWTSFWDDAVVKGPGWRKEKHGFDTLPLYVREGTVLVLGKALAQHGEGFEYDWLEDAEVKVYHPRADTKTVVVDCKGAEVGDLVVGPGGTLDLQQNFLTGQWTVKTVDWDEVGLRTVRY